MSVSVKRRALQKFLNDVLFEHGNLNYGIYNQPGPGAEDKEDIETTVPDEVPVSPTEQMATQISDDKPPIEDEEYLPSNPKELALAVSQVAQMIPSGQVEKFYRDVLRLYDDAVGEENNPETNSEDELEEAIRKQVRTIIEASFTNWDVPRYDDDDDDDYDWDPGDDEVQPVDMSSDEMSLDDLATLMGTGSITQMRQEIERILRRMRYLSAEIPPGDLEELRNIAVNAFIDEMESAGQVDAEDVADLKKSHAEGSPFVIEMDSFRFFFVAAFISPAFKEVKKNARLKVEAEIDKLGLPKKSRQTVLNQALGETPRSAEKLAKKITKDYTEENPGNESAALVGTGLAKKVNSVMDKLSKLSELDTDLLDIAKARWGKQSKGRRSKAFQQAMEETAAWQAFEEDSRNDR